MLRVMLREAVQPVVQEQLGFVSVVFLRVSTVFLQVQILVKPRSNVRMAEMKCGVPVGLLTTFLEQNVVCYIRAAD